MGLEQIPTFLWSKDQLVEVVFTEWEVFDNGEWRLSENNERFEVGQTATIDRIVFEMPYGCRQITGPLNLRAGDTIGFEYAEGARSLELCAPLEVENRQPSRLSTWLRSIARVR